MKILSPVLDQLLGWIHNERVAVLFFGAVYLLAGGLAIAFIWMAPATVFTAKHRIQPTLNEAAILFRRMGWCGIVWCATMWSVLAEIALWEPTTGFGPMVGLSLGFGPYVLFFVWMLTTARRLEADFSKYYRRARWTAVLAAAFFFPFLTIPAVLAVKRLEQYRRELDAASVPS